VSSVAFSPDGTAARTERLKEKIATLRTQQMRCQAMLQELERSGESQILLTDPDSRAMALNPYLAEQNLRILAENEDRRLPAAPGRCLQCGPELQQPFQLSNAEALPPLCVYGVDHYMSYSQPMRDCKRQEQIRYTLCDVLQTRPRPCENFAP
jgi:hypothetical protein